MLQTLNFIFFFFNDTATTEIYTLSLHDALPISAREELERFHRRVGTTTIYVTHDQVEAMAMGDRVLVLNKGDRKSTRLNSSHSQISYAVFCLKKKKNSKITRIAYVFINTTSYTT